MRRPRITLLDPGEVLPHEEVVPERVAALVKEILSEGALIRPVIVDAETGLLVDGHHRLAALKLLGARAVPAVLIDYATDVKRVIVRRSEALPALGAPKHVFEGEELLWLRNAIVSLPDPLPPRTTNHITWAKAVARPLTLRRLL